MIRRLLVPALLLGACATMRVITGTMVEDTKLNRQIIEVCEDYRRALEQRDAARLLTLASKRYYEDSGTPKAADDYGYDGLRQVLFTRLSSVRELRYNIEYRKITVAGDRAQVEIRYDASYNMATAAGERWERKQSDKRFDLENEDGRWRFVGGM